MCRAIAANSATKLPSPARCGASAGPGISVDIADESDLSNADRLTLKSRELLLDGKSVYGDPNSHRAKQKLAEYDAHVAFAQEQGTLPRPKPRTAQWVAEKTLAGEFPFGEPLPTIAEHHQVHVQTKLAETSLFTDRLRAHYEAELVSNLEQRPGPAAKQYFGYRKELGRSRSGSEIRDAMLADADLAIQATAKSPEEADRLRAHLRVDQTALELFAGKGQDVARYQARKKALGA
jgi:hypothetical protein